MRMSELSAASGVPIATIKFYLREGLVAPGIRTSPNQSSYDDSHVQRVRLIRALIDIGALSIASAKQVLAAVDDQALPLSYTFGIAQSLLPAGSPPSDAKPSDESVALMRSAVRAAGWGDCEGNVGIAAGARVLDAYDALGFGDLKSTVTPYAQAAAVIAAADLAALATRVGRQDMAELMVIGTVLGDSLVAALRRVAQEHVSNQVFPAPGAPGATPTTYQGESK